MTFTSSQPAQWRVGQVVGGNATLGTITTTGTTATYTAPAAIPPGGLVTVTAAHQDDLTLQATATVEILAPTDPLRAAPVTAARAPGAGPGDPLRAAPVSVAPAVTAAPLLTLVSVAPAATAAPLQAALVAVAREPVVSAVVDPATGLPAKFSVGTTDTVRLVGAGFTGGTAVAFTKLDHTTDANIVVNNFTVDGSTQITATITIAAGAATGFRVARVTAGGATSTAQPTGANLLQVQ